MRLIILAAAVALAGCGQISQPSIDDINEKVVEDELAKLEIVEKSGTAIDKCAQMGVVTAALLQAKDAERYQTYKVYERLACVDAGIIQ